MTRETLIRLRDFVLLLLVQVLIFSRIHLFGYATACIFIIFIIKLPRHTTRNEILIWSFLFGIGVDMFCNTPGLNAAAATLLGFIRNPLLAAFTQKGMPDDFTPGVRSLTWSRYMVYSLLCTLIFFTALFILELFTVVNPLTLFTSIAASSLLTMLFTIVIEFFSGKR
ncbi:MAG: rod shape-determining protein MreD [Bacteroidaceae bacterium]|nr:rod shape-determining protein MreD [Bacteroidaceae bacterium]